MPSNFTGAAQHNGSQYLRFTSPYTFAPVWHPLGITVIKECDIEEIERNLLAFRQFTTSYKSQDTARDLSIMFLTSLIMTSENVKTRSKRRYKAEKR